MDNSYINFIKIRKERETGGLPVTPLSLHAVFYGPPGPERQLPALWGAIHLGLLAKGTLLRRRAGLVAGYVGQTAVKTDDLCRALLTGCSL